MSAEQLDIAGPAGRIGKDAAVTVDCRGRSRVARLARAHREHEAGPSMGRYSNVWRCACDNPVMTKTELHELVDALPEEALVSAAVFLRSLMDGQIDPEQTWFWTSDWLAGELEADREADDNPGAVYKDGETFKAAQRAVR